MSTAKTFLEASKALEVLAQYPRSDGLSVKELMDSTVHGGLTYNDFLLLPGKIDFPASDVITESKITRNVTLKTPFMSSPMDTVTEKEMAVNMAVCIFISFHPFDTYLSMDSCSVALVLSITIKLLSLKLIWFALSSATKMAS